MRKCGHCKLQGHDKRTCPTLKALIVPTMDQKFHNNIDKIIMCQRWFRMILNKKKMMTLCNDFETMALDSTMSLDTKNKTLMDAMRNEDVKPRSKWVKELRGEGHLSVEEFHTRIGEQCFQKVADIVLDQDKTRTGKKSRNTLIKFDPVIDRQIWSRDTEWLYIFTIANKIVKIGGTRTGLKGRCSSYLCGHHTQDRGKSGDCSNTNAYIYNTFEYYLQNDEIIEMWGYELPQKIVYETILGQQVPIKAQIFHAYESTFMEKYRQIVGEYPELNDNADPDYR